MSFKIKEVLGNSKLMTHIIDNSDTIQVGDAVKLRNGNLEVAAGGEAIHGIVVDIVDKNGNSVFGSLAVVGSAAVTGTPAMGSGQVVVASDNETVDLIAAKVETSKDVVFSGDVDGTIGTTTVSNKAGGWFDLTDENSISETSHTRTITTGGQLKGLGTDPDDSTRLLVSINESEMWDSGTGLDG